MKKRPRKGVPDQLAEAYLEHFLKRIDQTIRYLVAGRHYESLLEVDPKVAKVAIKVFRSAEGAAFWLTRDTKELGGRVPLEVARTPEGAAEVVQLMQRTAPGHASPDRARPLA